MRISDWSSDVCSSDLVASIANKGFSEPIVSGPFSKLGHDAGIRTKNATCMALPTNQPINPLRNTKELREINQEQAFLPIYSYAAVTDSVEGLIMVNNETMADRKSTRLNSSH